MPSQLPVIELSTRDQEEIGRWLASHGTPQQVALRSRIVLAAAAGRSDSAVARELEINRKTVKLWRGRFAQEGVDSLLDVAPGRGRKPTFGPEKI
ncbi:MAG: helix-turn-helix domain-containing protein, partial [Terrimicrobiaceae bacterium]